MDDCIKCKNPIGTFKDGKERIGRYVSDETSVLQQKISDDYGVDEGFICIDCWDEIKESDDYKLLRLFGDLGVQE